MATDMLPGSFPDSVPATPNETPQPPTPADKHRQFNKLQRSGDTRGHSYTDSGVGLTDSEPIQSARPVESRTAVPEEVAGSGTTFSRDGNQGLETGAASTTLSAQRADDDVISGSNKTKQLAPDLAEGMPDPARPANAKAVDQSKQSDRESTPYWGDLPAQAGKGVYNSVAGVYNSVTGQGNAGADQTEQSHPQPNATGGPSIISGIAGQVGHTLRSGAATVYNSVPGLGNGSSDRTEQSHPQPKVESSDRPGIVGNVGNNLRSGAATVYDSLSSLGTARAGPAEERHSHPTSGLSDTLMVTGQVGDTLRTGAATVYSTAAGGATTVYDAVTGHRSGTDDQAEQDQRPGSRSSDKTIVAGHDGRSEQPPPQESKYSDETVASHDDRGEHRQSAHSQSDVPKEPARGVYNSVAGHGSAVDDHPQHHHLRPKSKSPDRAVIVGHVGDYPRGGGVYNTVVGHGSRDEESKRHSHSPRRSTDKAANMAAHAREPDDLLNTPWPKVPEGRQRKSPENAHGIAPGFLPELAVRDDVHLLAEAKARDEERVCSQPKHDTSPQRAFPLAPKAAEHHGEGTGAAGVGAGITAGQYLRDRREDSTRLTQRSQDEKETDPVTGRERRRSLGGHTAENRRRSRQRSPAENAGTHQDDSPTKHKLFGIFHRHKDNDKEESGAHRRKSAGDHGDTAREGPPVAHSPNRLQKHTRGGSTGDRKRSLSRSKADGNKRSSIGKDNVGAGAGAFGLLHRRKNSVSEHPRDATAPNWPLTADAGGVGPAGEAPRQVEQVSTPFEHPREAPLPPWSGGEQAADAAAEHRPYNTLPSGIQSGVQHAKAAPSTNEGIVTNEPGHYKTLASGTASGVAVASAAKPERQDVVSHERGDYNVLASSGAPKTGASRNNVKASETSDYHVHKSSGSPSPTRQDDAEDAAEYNVLPSGTPSGVKVKPRSTHHSGPAAHDQVSRGQRNPRLPEEPPSLPPVDITSSHVQTLRDLSGAPAAAEGLIPANPTYPHAELAQHMSPEVMPDSYRASSSSAPGHSHNQNDHHHQQSQYQSRTAAAAAAQNMSPEVMPDAYKASAPGHSHSHQAQQAHQPQLRGGDVDGTSNVKENGKSFSDRVQDVTSNRNANTNTKTGSSGNERNAALAAATSSWAAGSTIGSHSASSARKDGGAPILGGAQGGNTTGKVLHPCEHCGRENDITRYFSGQVPGSGQNNTGGVERSGSGLWQGRRV